MIVKIDKQIEIECTEDIDTNDGNESWNPDVGYVLLLCLVLAMVFTAIDILILGRRSI